MFDYIKDKSIAAYDYIEDKAKAGFSYLQDKKARWRKYYKEIKSYFSLRFLLDSITAQLLSILINKKKNRIKGFKFIFIYSIDYILHLLS